MSSRCVFRLVILLACLIAVAGLPGRMARGEPAETETVRLAAAQTSPRTVPYRLAPPAVLDAVDATIRELQSVVDRAGQAGCDVLCFPEDTLGLLAWTGMHPEQLVEVLPEAVARMNQRLGQAAARYGMYLITCSDSIDADGQIYNTAFLLGPDGHEIGRYHKVCPPLHEGVQPGNQLPVFQTSDLGTVGMLICYDLVMPETARCLALQGADVIFFPTMGGAAIGEGDIGRQALRVRAAENFVWLVVAHRGEGAMIVSPQGTVVAQAEGPDGLAIADVDPTGGRQAGDAMNYQQDIRARILRERNPAAFALLADPHPPALDRFPLDRAPGELARIAARVLTVGEEEFGQASDLAAGGKFAEAIARFKHLRRAYPGSWIDRRSAERLAVLTAGVAPDGANGRSDGADADSPDRINGQGATDRGAAAGGDEADPADAADVADPADDGGDQSPATGIAAAYPGDRGIEKDPRVIFVEDFESGPLPEIQARWEDVAQGDRMALSPDIPPSSGGGHSLLMTHVGGEGTGGLLYRRLPPGHEKLYARFYVKFDPDCAPIHHFGTCLGGNHPSTPWPQVRAGQRTDGDRAFWVGIEPFGESWRWDYYAYWCEMRGSPPRGQTWGNSFIRDPQLRVDRGRWTCVEMMIKMNDVGDTNGELALWIDGRPVSHLGKGFPKGKWVFDKFFPGQGGDSVRWNDARGERENFQTAEGGEPFEGFRWRTSEDLKINFLWTYVYITDAPEGHVSKVWFDDIVVATDYIGPLRP